jgi:hypothetical protein
MRTWAAPVAAKVALFRLVVFSVENQAAFHGGLGQVVEVAESPAHVGQGLA